MTEKDLIALGFERVDVTKEESGNPKDWHYYTYDFTQHLSLISNDNENAEKYGWIVEFLDADDIQFTRYMQLADLIDLIEKAKI